MNKDEQISCWFCGAQYCLSDSEFCTHTIPSPACPYCLNCFCTAPDTQRLAMRQKIEEQPAQSEQTRHLLFSKPIGSILQESGLITSTDLEKALLVQKDCGRALGEVLVEMGLVSADTMRITLLNQQWIEQIDLDKVSLDLRLIERFGFEFCSRHSILPIELLVIKDHGTLRIAISRRETLEAIRSHPAFQTFGILPYLAPADIIQTVLSKLRPRFPI